MTLLKISCTNLYSVKHYDETNIHIHIHIQKGMAGPCALLNMSSCSTDVDAFLYSDDNVA